MTTTVMGNVYAFEVAQDWQPQASCPPADAASGIQQESPPGSLRRGLANGLLAGGLFWLAVGYAWYTLV